MSDLGAKKWEYAATVAASQSVSTPVHLNNAALVGLYVPLGWTAADITFQVSRDGTNWSNVRDAEGTEVSLAGFSAGDYVALPAGAFHGVEYMRLRSGTSGSPVAQSGEGTLYAVIRPFQ